MCRYDPITKSERRCPSYLDKASYNAKRRARYHAQKGSSSVFNQQHDDGNVLMEKISPISFRINNSNIFTKKIVGSSLVDADENDVTYRVTGPSVENNNLNINIQKVEGNLVDAGYFNSEIFNGRIDHSSLDENSYKVFFDSIQDSITLNEEDSKLWKKKYDFNRTVPTLMNSEVILDLSTAEISSLSSDEKNALTFFSSDNYRWFNKALYTNGETLESSVPDGEHESVISGEVPFDPQRTKRNVLEASEAIDSAMEKAPKRQRKLYRGVKGHSSLFGNKKPHEWANGLTLGQELVFDGYQSASQDYETASGYTGSNGVLFEIITPEGIQITSCSEFAGENETLLPRDTRYTVVGIHSQVLNKKNSNHLSLNVVQLVAINSKGEILDGSNSDKPKPINLNKAE